MSFDAIESGGSPRRIEPPPPPPRPIAPPESARDAPLDPNVVAGAAHAQQRAGERAQELLGARPARDGEPALPTERAPGQAPYRVPHNANATVTPAEERGLNDPQTRSRTAAAVGERVARDEALNRAFGGAPNLEAARRAYANMDANGRARIAGTNPSQAPATLDEAVFRRNGRERESVVDRAADAARVEVPPQKVGLDDAAIGRRSADVARSLIEQGQGPRLTDAERAEARRDLLTRAGGAVRAGFGAVEIAAGATLAAAPTGVSQVAGAALIAHGADNVQAGVRQAATGRPTQGLVEGGIAAGLRAAGVDPETADTMAALTDGALSAGGLAGASSRIAARNAQRAAVLDPASPVQRALGRAEAGGVQATDDAAQGALRTARIGGGEASMETLRRNVDVWAQRVTGDPNARGQVFTRGTGNQLYGFMHEGRFYGMRSSTKETAGYVDAQGRAVAPHVSLEVRVPAAGRQSQNPWTWLTYENRHVNLR